MKRLILLLLCSCNVAPFEPSSMCQVNGMTFHFEATNNCTAIKENVQIMVDILVKYNIASEDTVKTRVSGVTVWVFDSVRTPGDYEGDDSVLGSYFDKTHEIYIDKYNRALLHEILHHFDYVYLNSTNSEEKSHIKWLDSSTSYTKADNEFALAMYHKMR